MERQRGKREGGKGKGRRRERGEERREVDEPCEIHQVA